MLKSIAPIRVLPISENHHELKSATYPENKNERKPAYSSKLALTRSNKRAVLKNWTMKTPLVINLVCSDSVS